MRVNVLLFGAEARAVGAASVAIEVNENATCAGVMEVLARDSAVLRPMLPQGRIALNGRFGGADERINASDEVALIGLVSGG